MRMNLIRAQLEKATSNILHCFMKETFTWMGISGYLS